MHIKIKRMPVDLRDLFQNSVRRRGNFRANTVAG
jgi:hypothetical protein